MKKTILLTLVIISYLLFGYSVKAEQINSFDSQISINKDGTIDVKETIVYDFEYLEKRGIYRDVPFVKTNQDGKKFKFNFLNFSVQDENGEGYNFTTSTVDEQITRLKIGDADRLVTGVHTYVISYKVSGAITYFSDHDELYWNVTGNDWIAPISVITSEVMFPDGAKKEDIKTVCYTGVSGSSESSCNYLINDRGQDIITSTRALSTGEGLTFAVSFPKNIVAVLEPEEFVPFSETLLGRLVSWLLILIGFIWYFLVPLYIIYRWFKYGRDPKATVGTTTAWFDPPKTHDNKRFLTPGEVGALSDETVDLKDVSATIVDLARREYLVIDERTKGDFYLVRHSPKKETVPLLPFENKLLEGLFTGGTDEIRIKGSDLASEIEKVKNSLYEQVVVDKFFDKNPQTTRTIYYVLAGIALFTGNIILAIVSFLFGRVMPRKTIFGVNAFNVSKSLKNFLTSQERQLKFQADKQLMFERLLPYAIAFGVEKIWAKRFQDIGLHQPNWYRSNSSGSFNSWIFVNSLNSSMRSFRTAATPTRSSSGFSSGFSGGSSGGGGGGGGGGSW